MGTWASGLVEIEDLMSDVSVESYKVHQKEMKTVNDEKVSETKGQLQRRNNEKNSDVVESVWKRKMKWCSGKGSLYKAKEFMVLPSLP